MAGWLSERRDGILTVWLQRPGVRNALDTTLLRELTAAFRAAARDAAVDVVVLTGVDPAFCAGLDLRELESDADGLVAMARERSTNPFCALRALPQPTICAVNGPAITGGLELALACDVLIASPRARFADTHGRVGVLPAQGLPALLSAAVGPPTARVMSLTGEAIDAEMALRAGLVSEIVAHGKLLERAHELASTIATYDRAAVRAIKASYRDGLLGTHADWLAREQRESIAWHRSAPTR